MDAPNKEHMKTKEWIIAEFNEAYMYENLQPPTNLYNNLLHIAESLSHITFDDLYAAYNSDMSCTLRLRYKNLRCSIDFSGDTIEYIVYCKVSMVKFKYISNKFEDFLNLVANEESH